MKTAIITFDIINEICHKDGKLARFAGRIEENNIIGNINSILKWARNNKHLIFHVRLGFRSNYKDSSLVSPIFKLAQKNKILQLSEWGSQFCESLQRCDSDIEIIKHRVSGFYGTELDLILRANRVEKLIMTGVATNNAVELTAREAHDRDYRVTVVSDATETVSDMEQKASLNFLSRIAEIQEKNELLK